MSACLPRYILNTFIHVFSLFVGQCYKATQSFQFVSVLLTKFVGTCFKSIQLPFSHCSSVLQDVSKMHGLAVSYSCSV